MSNVQKFLLYKYLYIPVFTVVQSCGQSCAESFKKQTNKQQGILRRLFEKIKSKKKLWVIFCIALAIVKWAIPKEMSPGRW